jgi:hypothetical protein
MPDFGKLERVGIRDAWPSEPTHFTPWLSQPENLATLSDEIGISLEFVGREYSVGNYFLDILARKAGTDEAVVIENQFGSTDHSHLGQLLTYAAGVGNDGSGARTIIWVAEKFNEPHRAALDWLNTSTDSNVRFFGVEIQLWKIGNSAFAPRFNVVSQPNDWQKQLTRKTSTLTETEQLYIAFWDGFYDLCNMEGTTLDFTAKQRKNSWIPTKIGRPGFGVNLNAVKNDKRLECHLWIDHSQAAKAYDSLLSQKALITSQLGEQVEFDEMEGRHAFKIFETKQCDLNNRTQWPIAQKWLKERGEAYSQFFSPLVKTLNLE